jgi:hypothetical protein
VQLRRNCYLALILACSWDLCDAALVHDDDLVADWGLKPGGDVRGVRRVGIATLARDAWGFG